MRLKYTVLLDRFSQTDNKCDKITLLFEVNHVTRQFYRD